MAGTEAGYIAVLALAWHLTGSASHASFILLASVAARTLGAPVAGWIGDHFDRRRVIVAADVIAGAVFGSLVLASSMTHALFAMSIGTFAMMTSGAALDAAVPQLVPAHELKRANATLGMMRTIGHLLGPVLGGICVATVGARGAFLVDGASSIIAALIVLSVRGAWSGSPQAANATDEHAEATSSPWAGVKIIASDPVLRAAVTGGVSLGACFAFITAAELPISIHHGYDELGLAFIIMGWCAGSILGSWSARTIDASTNPGHILASNAAACAVVFVGAGLAPWFSALVALMAIGGYTMARAEVVEISFLQERVADSVRARVVTACFGATSAAWGLMLTVAAPLVDATSPGITYIVGGVVAIGACAAFVSMSRRISAETSYAACAPRSSSAARPVNLSAGL